MLIATRLLALFILSGAAQSGPAFYFYTALPASLTCTQPVNWNTTKAPARPELNVANVSTPIRWPRDTNGDPQFVGERQAYGYDPLFAPSDEAFANDLEKKASSRVSIAPNGRPLFRDENLSLRVLMDDGRWQTIPLLPAALASLQSQGRTWKSPASTPLFATGVPQELRVVFDDDCHAYTVVNAYRSSLGFAFLLHSPDGGHSWAAYPLPGWSGDGGVRMELPTSTRTTLADPPVIVLHRLDDGAQRKAVLLFPRKNPDGTLERSADGFLKTADPVDDADVDYPTVHGTLCCANHSGSDTQVVSRGDRVHFAYPVDYTTAAGSRHGTPQYVATFSRSTGRLIGPPSYVGIGFTGPAAQPGDVCDPGEARQECDRPNEHNQPALALDSRGHLHVVVAGHGAQLWYLRSRYPDRSDSWLPAEQVGMRPSPTNRYADSYTYPSLVIDANDRPQLLARWSGDGDKYEFNLVHIVRGSDAAPWTTQQILINPDRSYYTSWYHKFSVDRWGHLLVSYYYYPANLFADEARRFAKVWKFPRLCEVDVAQAKCPGKIAEVPPRPDFNRADRHQKGYTYAAYTGYTAVSPGVLISIDNGATFQLGTTREFIRNAQPETRRKSR